MIPQPKIWRNQSQVIFEVLLIKALRSQIIFGGLLFIFKQWIEIKLL